MGKKRNKTPKKRPSLIRKGLLVLACLIVLATILGAAYCRYLSENIQARFSGRKWEIPSTVYSDTFVLFPGKRLTPMLLKDKLERLGYRKTRKRPEKKGAYSVDGQDFAIYFKDLDLPDNKREGFLTEISLDGNTIRRMRRMDTAAPRWRPCGRE